MGRALLDSRSATIWPSMREPTEAEMTEIVPKGPLFKFLSLASNQSPTWQDRLGQLLDGKAYHPSPRQFNDPFDCLPRILMPQTIEELRAKQHILVARFAQHIPDRTPEEIAQIMSDVFDKLPLEDLNDQISRTVRKTNETMGVFSLAETINNVLMWSHYASNHSGIAVRFDWRKQLRGGLMPLFKVRYEEIRPSILNFFDEKFTDDDEIIADAMRTKADFWRYEQEWRSLQPGKAGQIIDFDPAVIDGIVFGALCSQEDEMWIRAQVRDRPVAIARAFADADTYKIHFMAKENDAAQFSDGLRNFPHS